MSTKGPSNSHIPNVVKNRYLLSRDMVKAVFLDETVKKIRLDPVPEPEEDFSTYPKVDFLKAGIRYPDPVDDAVLRELRPGTGAMFETTDDNFVVYFNDGDIIYVIQATKTADVKRFINAYPDGSFELTKHEEPGTKKMYYLLQPSTQNLLDKFKNFIKQLPRN